MSADLEKAPDREDTQLIMERTLEGEHRFMRQAVDVACGVTWYQSADPEVDRPEHTATASINNRGGLPIHDLPAIWNRGYRPPDRPRLPQLVGDHH